MDLGWKLELLANGVFHKWKNDCLINNFLVTCSTVQDQLSNRTHFCDLLQYFEGEVDIASVQAYSLEWHENAGQLSKITIDESKILLENCICCVTQHISTQPTNGLEMHLRLCIKPWVSFFWCFCQLLLVHEPVFWPPFSWDHILAYS